MFRLSPTRIISILIFIFSAMVMAGWIFNIPSFTHVLPKQQPMAFVTAFSFFLSSIALWFIEDAMAGKTEIAMMIIPATTLITFLLMTTLVAASLFGAYTGITDLFLTGSSIFVPINPGMPAIMTVFGFILFGASAIHSFFVDIGPMSKTIHLFEILIIILGSVAVLGYILGIPLLTYQFTPASTPIALNTSITFILLGIGVFLAEKNRES